MLTPRAVFHDGRSNAHLIVGDGSERFEQELDFALVGPDDLTPSKKKP
ncbi:MAG: hypothetical protein VYE40_15210 [Myxococcota bacterium]|nr:hypothetical protein [Myxococcota bacterium]